MLLALAALLCLAAISPAVAAAGSISGTVTDAVSETALEDIEVCAWSLEEEEEEDFGCAFTAADGSYEITGLDPLDYMVEFWDADGKYAGQFFDRRSFFWEAEPVTVEAGAVTGIDAELILGGFIQGTVRAASNGAALNEILVCAFELATGAGTCNFTDPAGSYTLRRLIPGTYKVEFWDVEEIFDIQFWDHTAIWEEADEISIDAGQTAGSINADLLGGPPAPPITTPSAVAPPTVTPPPVTKPRPKPKRCKKGLRKKKVKGKVRCVKVKKHRKHRAKNSSAWFKLPA